MINDKNRIFDGWLSLEGGVDSGRNPATIDPNQCVSAENMSFRGGDCVPRPGFRKLTEEFKNPDHTYNEMGLDSGTQQGETFRRADDCYKEDRMQCALVYNPHGLADCIMALIGGRLFKIVPRKDTAVVTEITPIADPESPYIGVPPGDYAAPPNDNRAAAIVISGATDDEDGTTLGATTEPSEPTFPTRGINTVWYKWTGITTNQRQYFRVTPGHVIDVYKVIGSVWVTSGNGLVSFIQTAGTAYNIRVRPADLQRVGNFTLKWKNLTAPDVIPDPGIPEKNRLAYRNRKDLPVAYMLQADKWFLAQDGVSKCIIYDGVNARRSHNVGNIDDTEIPTGTIMAYGMGRVVVIVNQRDVAFGDLFGSHITEDPADSLILFTERNYLAEGFDAALPVQNGIATGLAFFPQLDTSTGNGQLLAFSERGASSFFMSLPRELWKTSQFQIFALLTTGLRGHRSIATVNEDLWFRAEDGTRSYRQARSEASGWAHIPLSTNVRQFLEPDPKRLLQFCSAIYFSNRYIVTTSPYWNHRRPLHDGFVVVDFDILSSFGTRFKPAWEGHWTIPDNKISQIIQGEFNGVPRTFVFGVDELGHNQLYELSENDLDDWDGQSVEWELVSRMFDFTKLSQQSNPFTESDLYDADLWIREVAQSVGISPMHSIQTFYRPDDYPEWIPWKQFDARTLQMIGRAGSVDNAGLPTIRAGFRPRISFGKPQNATDKNTRRNTRRGFQFQVKFKGTGHIVLDRFRLHAQKQVERATAKNL